jgi:SAM-dependent methyltransferase|tara:strand:+ start:92 stop:1270 length:1179 start_codon:yes stop_codon:yes gene_type:complete
MLKKFLDLGKQPIANGFLFRDQISEEYFFNLGVAFDEETKLVTQTEYVDPPLMFNDEYVYRGSMSKTMREHFKKLSGVLWENDNPMPKVLEIGSNDGVFLKHWPTDSTVAVEPCGNFAKETRRMGYKTYKEFWCTELAKEIKLVDGERDIIFAANCICHIPNLDEAFKAVNLLLKDDGVFIFEDPSLAEVINNNSYDQIYDEHPHVFSVIALDNLLNRCGLEIIKVENITVHGGSNRVYVMKKGFGVVDVSVEQNKSYERVLGLDDFETFLRFAKRVEQSKEDLVRLLTKCKDEGKKVISYGASSKSTTIFNYCGIGPELLSYITDTTPEKQGKLSPGMHIPVIAPEQGFNNTVHFAYLGAWNFIKEIKDKEKDFVGGGGKFITHVPTIQVV